MVRKKNQGFSLIEVVVAVAILSLLLAPIISQVIQTLHVSAQAKERQRAVEHAEYLLNCVQDIPISDLNGVANKLGEASSPAEGVGEDETTTVTTTSNSVKLKTGDTELEFTGAVAKPTVEVKIHSCTSYGDITSYANRGYKDGDPKKGPIGVPVISKEMVETPLRVLTW